MVIRRINASHYVLQLVASNFAKNGKKLQTRIIFEHFLFALLSVVLPLRHAPKNNLSKPKWGAHAVVRGYGPLGLPVATSLPVRTQI